MLAFCSNKKFVIPAMTPVLSRPITVMVANRVTAKKAAGAGSTPAWFGRSFCISTVQGACV
jgi:hypothetical protein